MTITAKYAGRCQKCGAPIAAGQPIEWEKGQGARHVNDDACLQARQPGVEQPEPLDISVIPSGRYAVGDKLLAVDNLTGETQGMWAGWVFVAELVDHTNRNRRKAGSQRPANTYHGPTQMRALLEQIADDPQAAAKAFGKQTGHCGRCGRKLTDPVSIEFGIGPVCREWFHELEVA